MCYAVKEESVTKNKTYIPMIKIISLKIFFIKAYLFYEICPTLSFKKIYREGLFMIRRNNRTLSVISILLLFLFFMGIMFGPIASVKADENIGLLASGNNQYVDDGIYYIKNKQTNTYMQIDDNDSGNNFGTDGAFMELWGYSGKDQQRWKFTYLNNGYYKIESVISGKALAVKAGKENVDGEALIQESYSGATRQQWNLEQLSGGYAIRARSSDAYRPANDWCMCAGANAFGITAGLNVEQRRRSVDSDYKDEWIIECDQITITPYYDNAFNVRYGPSVITELLSRAANVYWRILNLKINFSSPVLITSTPDSCKIHNNGGVDSYTMNNMCPANPSRSSPYCGYYNSNKVNNSDCENCTGWYQIYKDFIKAHPGSSKNASVIFTGNKLYDDNGIDCNRSYNWYDYGLCLQDISASKNDYCTSNMNCIVHELAHFVGAPDHYHEPIQDSNGEWHCRGGDMCNDCSQNPAEIRDGWCMMDEEYPYNVETCGADQLFCPKCLVDIRNTIISKH